MSKSLFTTVFVAVAGALMLVASCGSRAEPIERPITCWEYRQELHQLSTEELTALGTEGWELCCFAGKGGTDTLPWVYVFKRPLRLSNG